MNTSGDLSKLVSLSAYVFAVNLLLRVVRRRQDLPLGEPASTSSRKHFLTLEERAAATDAWLKDYINSNNLEKPERKQHIERWLDLLSHGHEPTHRTLRNLASRWCKSTGRGPDFYLLALGDALTQEREEGINQKASMEKNEFFISVSKYAPQFGLPSEADFDNPEIKSALRCTLLGQEPRGDGLTACLDNGWLKKPDAASTEGPAYVFPNWLHEWFCYYKLGLENPDWPGRRRFQQKFLEVGSGENDRQRPQEAPEMREVRQEIRRLATGQGDVAPEA